MSATFHTGQRVMVTAPCPAYPHITKGATGRVIEKSAGRYLGVAIDGIVGAFNYMHVELRPIAADAPVVTPFRFTPKGKKGVTP